MRKFPVDAPADAPKSRGSLRFDPPDLRWYGKRSTLPCGAETAGSGSDFLSMPNHATLKASTLRTVTTQAGITREDFLRAYQESQSTLFPTP